MFELVADIEAYPVFIPWCKSANITAQTKDPITHYEVIDANMSISFKLYSETFSSRVSLDKIDKEIVVEYLNGPFKFLNNSWSFADHQDGCLINFHVEFELKSKILQRFISVVFNEAMRRVILSFEKRAKELYF